MRLFFDTSALIKKYVTEDGSEKVDALMNKAESIIVSVITAIEAHFTFKRLLIENAIDESDYQTLINEFEIDYPYYSHVVFDELISSNAKSLIDKYQLKTLDSIQLGTAVLLKDEIDYFVVCDSKLVKAGKKDRLKIINPIG